jgi:hypothetical protein
MHSQKYRNRIQMAILILILIDIFLVIYSCQHRSRINPIESGFLPGPENMTDDVYSPPVYMSSDSDGDVETGIGSMGAYIAHIDVPAKNGTLVPIRAGQNVGDDHIVDITGFLNGSPCGDCFNINSIALNALGELEVEFTMQHPFPLPKSNPPGLKDRLDLHVFDVQAIFFFSESGNKTQFEYTSDAVLDPVGGAHILETDNSGFWASQHWDGFTDHFDEYVDGFYKTSSNLHPYFIFFEDKTTGNFDPDSVNGFTDLYNPTGYNVFQQGSGTDRKIVNFGSNPGNEIGFVVLLSAAYGQSAKFWGNDPGQRGNPRYFLPEFNRKEPWKVEVEIPSATDQLIAQDDTSSTVINVKVYDWQHSLGNVRGDYNPYTASLDSMKRSSRVNRVCVEIPGVNNMTQSVKAQTGTGVGENPLIFKFTITNELKAQQGKYTGLVAVVDELHGTYLGGYGVERDRSLFDMNRFAAYSLFQVNVVARGGESFSVGFNIYDDDGGSGTNRGDGVSLDSFSASNMVVHENNVYIIGSIINGPAGSDWDVFLIRSTDSGMSFEAPRILNNDYNSGYIGNQNQPSIAVAPDTGYVYIMFTDKSENRSNVTGDAVIVRRSTDQGMTFSTPGTQINPSGGACDMGVLEAGPGGLVWAAYRHRYDYPVNNSRLVMQVSDNYGQSFSTGHIETLVPMNYEYPMIVCSNNQTGSPGLVALLWRQQSLLEPDIKCAVAYDYDMSVMLPLKISGDAFNQFATFPRATIDREGNIYCVYRISSAYDLPSTLKLSVGQYHGYNYHIWQCQDIKKEPDLLFGDIDIFYTQSDHLYICWNQLDNVNTTNGQDVYVYRSALGASGWAEYAHIKEPTEFFADQDMPRFTSDDSGRIYMAYRDNTYSDGGDFFFTQAYE